ncbi:MAG: UDP-N-acetylmuramoyl-tripeptide--D-alanyl-D-alanine ligase [Actinomycetaceae bacterium]|nr:UDP-N-acetylmuramoyl-tripeptide--D-alanyl-D-alanine ligase [Actinomycetaceae bacterium]
MITFSLDQIADCVKALAWMPGLPGNQETRPVKIVVDSRVLEPGDIFCALPGASVDGHRFVDQVCAAGAAAVIVSMPVEEVIARGMCKPFEPGDTRVLVVPDTTHALGDIARLHLQTLRKHGNMKTVIGVTGSAGKTTTKDLLATLLGSQGPTIAPVNSFNNEIGLPLTIFRADHSTQYLIMEMGADAPGDLTYLTSIAPLDIAVILMVGHAHLGKYKNIDQVAEAKAEILGGLREDGIAILNRDDERVRSMSPPPGRQTRYFSSLVSSEVWASEVAVTPLSRANFTLHAHGRQAPVALQLVGEHHVSNALAAAAVALEIGMSVEDVAKVLSTTQASSIHRMSLFTLAQDIRVLDDSYNANPDSMQAAFKAVQNLAQDSRIIAVLGPMLELGDSSPTAHRMIGKTAALSGSDVLITFGAQGQDYIDGFNEGALGKNLGEKVTYLCEDASDALIRLREVMEAQDFVVIKGSWGSRAWTIAEELERKGL